MVLCNVNQAEDTVVLKQYFQDLIISISAVAAMLPTKRHFKVRICEHLGISNLIEKKVKADNNKLTAIQEQLLCRNYSPSFEDFSILTREINDFKLRIMKSLLITRDKPILNKADSFLPLELF